MKIQSNKISYIGLFAAGFLSTLALAIPALSLNASAQSVLQENPGGLQSQTGQTQNANNNLGQTGTPQTQNSGSQDVLQQNGTRPLGVVSDPDQQTPEAVAQPSDSLRTDVASEEESSNTFLYILGGLVLAALVIFGFRLMRTDRQQAVQNAADFETPEITPEPLPAQKKKKSAKKKRKKGGRR